MAQSAKLVALVLAVTILVWGFGSYGAMVLIVVGAVWVLCAVSAAAARSFSQGR